MISTNKMIIIMMILVCIKISGGQVCTERGNIVQDGDDSLGRRRLGIVPRLSFTCNGTVIRIMARVIRDTNTDRNDYPYFQVWRPSSTNSMVYTNIGEVQLQESQVSQCNSNDYCNVNIVLTGNDRIKFQSGDVVGYYHPDQTIYQVRTIETNGYVLYRIDGSLAPPSVDLSTVADNRIDDQRQPLIQFVIDGQTCTDSVDIQQDGDDELGLNRLAIVPRLSFACDGRISGINARVKFDGSADNTDYPYFQIWRPSVTDSYTNIGEVQLQESQVSQCNNNDYCIVNIVLTGNDTIKFQSGDVVGYYHPDPTDYEVTTIQTLEYVQYHFDGSPAPTSVDLSVADGMNEQRQPLIQFEIDIRCRNLSSPSVEELSCSSGDIGVGYEGDTCSFTCNTGYELTGSDGRTCQSDGSWNETDNVCSRVRCPLLTDPDNGTVTCSLGNDQVPSFEDVCSFTCNFGYVLTDSDTKTCQSNGSWSGSDDVCTPLGCTDLVDILQDGNDELGRNRLGIVPRLNFTCDGRITRVVARVNRDNNMDRNDYPYFQVWRPSSTNSMVYTNIGEVQLQESQVSQCNNNDYCNVNIVLTGNDTIEFQSGDVVGYYHPDQTIYQVTTIQTSVYVLYRIDGSPAPISVDLSTVANNRIDDQRQPLIQFVIDLQCGNLSNGEITSCSSGSIEVVYEGDTCSFTCNAGYELTGSDTRTCQSDGSWSGSDDVCRRVSCPSLIDPNNGTINCSLGDDGVPSYEDTCSFACNTGYELTGSDTRTCRSNGSWSGSDVECLIVSCPSLTNPTNGVINCTLGDDGVLSYEDTCSFTCNTGYELTGSDMRTCQSNGNWSGTVTMCRTVTCQSLTDPNNGVINCSLGDDGVPSYEDTCNFTCNTGYELTGSDNRTCQSDGSWSGSNDVCRRVLVESSGDSGSAGAAVGGAIGGILAFTLLIVLVLLILFYVRRSQRKSAFSINHESSDSKDKKDAVLGNAIAVYDSIELTPQSHYEEPNYSVTDKDVSRRDGAREPMPYEVPLDPTFEDSINEYEYGCVSPFELAQSMEVEQQIYVTPCEEDYGPVYQKPPSDEHKIYEEFEGKRFHKLFHKEVVSLEQLGTGEFGVVNRGMWNPSTTKKVEVAIKTLNTNSIAKDRLRFLQEAVIMCQFDHENVIKLYGVVTDAPAMIVLEYMSHGDLRNVLLELPPNGGKPIPEKLPLLLLKFCKEISAGMTYLSGKKFIHRDLAARNILVSEQFTCKIADFGMSRDLLDDNYYVTSGGKIPVKWTAPEAIYYRKYSLYSDVWSYGCVLYEIWSLGHKPFENIPTSQTMLEKLEMGYRLPPPPGCPRVLYRIMIKCWNPDPKLRPQFGQITKLLASNSGYLLSWSDEDKQIGGEEAMKLGGALETGNNLYYDLQCTYK